jgi:hypothetical protein
MEHFADVMKIPPDLISSTETSSLALPSGKHISTSPLTEKLPSRRELGVETIGRNGQEDWTLADSAGFLWTFSVLALFPKMEAPLFAGTPAPPGF